MSTAAEVQALLRFLSQDAKVPLPVAMSKVKELQKASLTSPASLAKSDIQSVNTIFQDEKLAKQVVNAAKRLSKKRTSSDAPVSLPTKRSKSMKGEEPMSPAAIEESLSLPDIMVDEDGLAKTILYTNRAPLVLAFTLSLLKYTRPDQPLSSRLSLAQAVVSVNSRSKAVSLGLEKGTSAEEEGWGQGQPTVRIMGRDIRVMKRRGYEWKEGIITKNDPKVTAEQKLDETGGIKSEDIQDESQQEPQAQSEVEPALWGIDLEALRSSNGSVKSTSPDTNTGGLPIYTPQSARAYLVKSFASGPIPSTDLTKESPKKRSANVIAAEKERNLALLLEALDRLYSSWAHILSKAELDRRAWSWYVHVRPEVQNGVAGWGGKGEVKLSDILNLRRKA